VTAEYDPLRDDGFAYAKALRNAAVPVTHHHYDDVVHAFFSLVNVRRPNRAGPSSLTVADAATVDAADQMGGGLKASGLRRYPRP